MSAVAEPAPATDRGRARRRWLLRLAAGLAVVAAAAGSWWFLIGSRQVVTQDAYVDADVVTLAAMVTGLVDRVPAMETQAVRRGDVLLVMDPTEHDLAVARARAELAQAELTVRGHHANERVLDAEVRGRDGAVAEARAVLAAARSSLTEAADDLARRRRLAASGVISTADLQRAQARHDAAASTLNAARAAVERAVAGATASTEQRRAAAILSAGPDVEQHPDVVLARARLAAAELDRARTVVRAPVDGLVARRRVEAGQRVEAGTALLSIVPIQSVHVEANFKESQLRRIRVGAPAEVTSDLYGRDVRYRGRVVGIAGGTGSAFALIPAQNASGTWVKVVQRVPVRIAIDPKELAARPLRVGLSMTVKVADF